MRHNFDFMPSLNLKNACVSLAPHLLCCVTWWRDQFAKRDQIYFRNLNCILKNSSPLHRSEPSSPASVHTSYVQMTASLWGERPVNTENQIFLKNSRWICLSKAFILAFRKKSIAFSELTLLIYILTQPTSLHMLGWLDIMLCSHQARIKRFTRIKWLTRVN